MKTPRLKSPGVNVTGGKEAPGLKSRQHDILRKALGLADTTKVTPQLALKAIHHPDPRVKGAAQAIIGKGFKLGA